jgi:hypothetical protein
MNSMKSPRHKEDKYNRCGREDTTYYVEERRFISCVITHVLGK